MNRSRAFASVTPGARYIGIRNKDQDKIRELSDWAERIIVFEPWMITSIPLEHASKIRCVDIEDTMIFGSNDDEWTVLEGNGSVVIQPGQSKSVIEQNLKDVMPSGFALKHAPECLDGQDTVSNLVPKNRQRPDGGVRPSNKRGNEVREGKAKDDWFSHRRCSVCGKVFAKVANMEIHEQYVHGINHGRARNGRKIDTPRSSNQEGAKK